MSPHRHRPRSSRRRRRAHIALIFSALAGAPVAEESAALRGPVVRGRLGSGTVDGCGPAFATYCRLPARPISSTTYATPNVTGCIRSSAASGSDVAGSAPGGRWRRASRSSPSRWRAGRRPRAGVGPVRRRIRGASTRYSFALKVVVGLDVVTIAALFVSRCRRRGGYPGPSLSLAARVHGAARALPRARETAR